jgi:hypothetical protein
MRDEADDENERYHGSGADAEGDEVELEVKEMEEVITSATPCDWGWPF